MVKHSVYLLVIAAILSINTSLQAETIYDVLTPKMGTVEKNETWSGDIFLIGDVKIDPEVTVTLSPKTRLIFASTDQKNLGQDPNKTELIVDGEVQKLTPETSIPILQDTDPAIQAIFKRFDTDAITLAAAPFDSQSATQELHRYRRQYAVGWAMVYALIGVFAK